MLRTLVRAPGLGKLCLLQAQQASYSALSSSAAWSRAEPGSAHNTTFNVQWSPLRHFAAEPAFKESEDPHKRYDEDYIAPHPGMRQGRKSGPDDNLMNWPAYEDLYVESIKPKHLQPEKLYQKSGYYLVQLMRGGFDFATNYGPNMDEKKWIRRIIFLETIAGVPGMVAGMLRHMRSLRSMNKDNGWIHTLLEEAENERMHLLTFLQLRKPGPAFRAMVLMAQGVFFNLYFLFYIIAPRHCHAFVGYLEEEAVKTYTRCLEDYDAGKIPEWTDKPAPDVAREYWNLREGATMRDLILAVRADEACHSHVNHTFSTMDKKDKSPFVAGSHIVP